MEAARPLHEWQKEWQKVNAPPDGKQSPEMSKKKQGQTSPRLLLLQRLIYLTQRLS